ncbi:hypothetical protein [Schlesneria sp. T3-172]|uniref:hypothetical protein n=1 Tax=Schlesneria sphaerica TaxID=3373610 RepID=UPI0037C6A609
MMFTTDGACDERAVRQPVDGREDPLNDWMMKERIELQVARRRYATGGSIKY